MGLLWDLIKSIIKIYQNQNVKSLSSHVSLWGSHLGHNKFIVLLLPDGTPIAVWYFPRRPSYLQACWAKCFSGQVPPTSRQGPFLVIPMWVISWHSPGLKIGEHFWHLHHLHFSVSGDVIRDKARYLPEVLEVLGKAYWRPWEEGLTFQTNESMWNAYLMPDWDLFHVFFCIFSECLSSNQCQDLAALNEKATPLPSEDPSNYPSMTKVSTSAFEPAMMVWYAGWFQNVSNECTANGI